jgi:hypothetical protein
VNFDPLPEWERSVSVGFRFRTRNGGAVALSTIELWSDRVLLYFGCEVTAPPLTGPDGRPGIGPFFLLADDIGTPYRPHGGGAGGSRDLNFGRQEFQPAVPEEASALYVSSPELLDPISVPL